MGILQWVLEGVRLTLSIITMILAIRILRK